MKDNSVSEVVIKRLPRYYRYLGELVSKNIKRISSKELSKMLGVTASQIRQDLNCFGGFGQQGYGYNVEMLYDEIGTILGIKNGYKAIIIGAGYLGHALACYNGFAKRGFSIVGIFDTDPAKIGKQIGNHMVYDYAQIDEFLEINKPQIAMLAVPKTSVNEVAAKVTSKGVKALMNFAYVDLSLPDDVAVENVHLSDSIMTLSYKLNQLENKGDSK